jgi:hypothetical protein
MRLHLARLSDMHDENLEDPLDKAAEQPTAAMKRIAAYILEFQAKYRQLEEEHRKQRWGSGEHKTE